MASIIVPKGESLTITVVGFEDYPQMFDFEDVLELVLQGAVRDNAKVREKNRQEKYAKEMTNYDLKNADQKMQASVMNPGINYANRLHS